MEYFCIIISSALESKMICSKESEKECVCVGVCVCVSVCVCVFVYVIWAFPSGSAGKNPDCQCRRHEMWVWSLIEEDPLEEDMASHSSILAWRIPWTEEPGGLWSIGSQRVRHDWSDLARMHVIYMCVCVCVCVLLYIIYLYNWITLLHTWN